MRAYLGCGFVLAAAALTALGGCSTTETKSLCASVSTAEIDDFSFSASPNTTVRVITTPPAMKHCTASLDVKARYADEERSRAKAPQNIKVEFGVEDGTADAPTFFPGGDPEYTTQYYRRYIQWGISVNAPSREEPVQYFIRVGTDANGDDPVLVDAVIKFSAYESPPPPGIPQ
jgi:hypothetical protein